MTDTRKKAGTEKELTQKDRESQKTIRTGHGNVRAQIAEKTQLDFDDGSRPEKEKGHRVFARTGRGPIHGDGQTAKHRRM